MSLVSTQSAKPLRSYKWKTVKWIQISATSSKNYLTKVSIESIVLNKTNSNTWKFGSHAYLFKIYNPLYDLFKKIWNQNSDFVTLGQNLYHWIYLAKSLKMIINSTRSVESLRSDKQKTFKWKSRKCKRISWTHGAAKNFWYFWVRLIECYRNGILLDFYNTLDHTGHIKYF